MYAIEFLRSQRKSNFQNALWPIESQLQWHHFNEHRCVCVFVFLNQRYRLTTLAQLLINNLHTIQWIRWLVVHLHVILHCVFCLLFFFLSIFVPVIEPNCDISKQLLRVFVVFSGDEWLNDAAVIVVELVA